MLSSQEASVYMSLEQLFNNPDSSESFQLLKAVFEDAIDGMIIINEYGIMEAINPAAAELFGYTPDEVVGENVKLLMPPPDHAHHDDYIKNYKQTGIKKIIGIGREVEGLRKDGTVFPFRLSVSETYTLRRRTFTGFIHDVSDLKAAQEQLIALNTQLENLVEERTESLTKVVNKLLATNRQLEHEVKERKAAEAELRQKEMEIREALEKEKELGVLKSRFVSMASHEFRTPLTTVLSSASLLGRYLERGDTTKGGKHVDRIKSAVNNLTGILNDFLSLSKLEEGGVSVQKEWFGWDDFCRHMLPELDGVLKAGQRIEHKTLETNMQVFLDPRLVKNIMLNLLSNACKYSPEDGTIWCSNRLEGEYLITEIRDEGIGIPEEDQQYLFTRFFRASNAVNIKGTGLGLNIVSRYVRLLGGDIHFESRLNEGSTFTIVLPINEST